MGRTERIAAGLGLVGGVLALVLFLLAIGTGGSQGFFQINRPSAEYAALMVARAPYLRADLGLDFIFLTVYAAFFVALCSVLSAWRRRNGSPVEQMLMVHVATAALLITAALDVVENCHILALLSMAEQGQPIPQVDIAWQQAESQVKFVASYFGLFLLSFALPSDTMIEKLTVFALRWLQLPIGVAIFVAPTQIAQPLFVVRAVFFFVGLWLTAWIVWRRRDDGHSGSPEREG